MYTLHHRLHQSTNTNDHDVVLTGNNYMTSIHTLESCYMPNKHIGLYCIDSPIQSIYQQHRTDQ